MYEEFARDRESLTRRLFLCSCAADLLYKENPQAEKHSVEHVFEDIVVQHMEPVGVELHEQRDEEDTKDIKGMAAYPADRYIPNLMHPAAAHRQDKTHPDKHLLQTRTTPDDRGAAAGLKTDRVVAHHESRVSEPTYHLIHHPSDMACHELKRRCNIHSEPRHLLAVLVTHHRPFPRVVRHQQRYHENDNVLVGFEG